MSRKRSRDPIRKDTKIVKWTKNEKTKRRISENLEELMKLIHIDPNGGDFTTEIFKEDAYLHILSYLIELHEITSMELRRSMIRRAAARLKTVKKRDIFTFRRVLASVVRKHLKTPLRKYYMVFPLNLHHECIENRRWFTVLGIRFKIRTWNNVNKKFEIRKWTNRRPEYSKNLSEKFIPIVVEQMGGSSSEAFNKANDSFSLLRSVLNLSIKYKVATFQGGLPKPLGEILPPPIYGIFNADGNFDNCYYSTTDSSRDYNKCRISPGKIEIAKKILKQLTFPVDDNDIMGALINAFQGYGKALETNDWREAFLYLWQALEMITFRPEETYNMKNVCERIETLLNGNLVLSDLLWTAHEARNKLVHRGLFPEGGLTDVNMLKALRAF